MNFETLLTFNIVLLTAIAVPGPALVYFMRISMAQGWGAGTATGLGLATCAALWTLLALLGLEAIFALVPWAFGAAKIAGALYLFWIAWTTWRRAGEPVTASAAPRARSYVAGFLVNLANPKSVLFAAAVIVVIFPTDLSLTQKGLVAANHFAVEAVVYGALARILGSAAVSRRYLAAKRHLDRLSAVVMGGLGLRLILDR